MEQQQKAVTQQQQRALEGVTGTSSMQAEDMFDTMRQVAVNMFKQRTKDLTRLSNLQEQHRQLEQGLASIQGTIAKLHTLHAEVDADIEKEEQRAAEREGQLQQLHATMVELSDDQKGFDQAFHTTERVLSVVDNFMKGILDKDSRLMQLLEQAHQKVAGRTAGDFRCLASDLRRRIVIVKEFVVEARRSGALPTGLSRQLREWCQGNWKAHQELGEVMQLAEIILSPPVSSSPSIPVCPLKFDKDVLFGVPAPENGELCNAEDPVAIKGEGGTIEDLDGEHSFGRFNSLLQQTMRLSEARLQELQLLDRERVSAGKRCEGHGVSCEILDPSTILRVQNEWKQFMENYKQWIRVLVDIDATHRSICMEQEIQQGIQDAIQKENHILEDERRGFEADEKKILHLQKEHEDYASALQKGISTMQALQSAIGCLEQQTKEVGVAIGAQRSLVEQLHATTSADAGIRSAAICPLRTAHQEALDVLADAQAQESAAAIRADQSEEQVKELQEILSQLKKTACSVQDIPEGKLRKLLDHANATAQAIGGLSEIDGEAGDAARLSDTVCDMSTIDEKSLSHIFTLLLESNKDSQDEDASASARFSGFGAAICDFLVLKLSNNENLKHVDTSLWQTIVQRLTEEARLFRQEAKEHEIFLLRVTKEAELLTKS